MSLLNISTISPPLLPYSIVGRMESLSPATHIQFNYLHSGTTFLLNGFTSSSHYPKIEGAKGGGRFGAEEGREDIGLSFPPERHCCPQSASTCSHLRVNQTLLLCNILQTWHQGTFFFPFPSVLNTVPDMGVLQWLVIVHTPRWVLFDFLRSSVMGFSYSDLQPFIVQLAPLCLGNEFHNCEIHSGKWHASLFLLDSPLEAAVF